MSNRSTSKTMARGLDNISSIRNGGLLEDLADKIYDQEGVDHRHHQHRAGRQESGRGRSRVDR